MTVGAGDGTVSARKTGFRETRLQIAPRDGQMLRLHLRLRADEGGYFRNLADTSGSERPSSMPMRRSTWRCRKAGMMELNLV